MSVRCPKCELPIDPSFPHARTGIGWDDCLNAALAEIARLRARCEELERRTDYGKQMYAALEADNARLRARVDELQNGKLWECDRCGLRMDKAQENMDGSGYSCPECEAAEIRAERDRLREYVSSKVECPCCMELEECLNDCTYSTDCPDQHREMDAARAALKGTK